MGAAEPSVLAAHSWDWAIALVKGTLKKVEDILSNFNDAMGTVTCKGCPAGMGGSRKKRDTSTQPLDLDLCSHPSAQAAEQQIKSQNHPDQMYETMPVTRTSD